MSVSPRRRGMRSTRGLHGGGGGLWVTSAPAGTPLQCRSAPAGNAAAPAHGRLLLHDLPERGDVLLGVKQPSAGNAIQTWGRKHKTGPAATERTANAFCAHSVENFYCEIKQMQKMCQRTLPWTSQTRPRTRGYRPGQSPNSCDPCSAKTASWTTSSPFKRLGDSGLLSKHTG